MRLRQLLAAQCVGGGNVTWIEPGQGELRLRVEAVSTAHSEVIYVCRRYCLPPSELTSLGMPQSIAAKLMAPDLLSGLVLFFGKAGAGKTTTASSLLVERLSKFGGVGWTIENPTELNLQGQHGRGWCYQTEVESETAIGPAIHQLMRATPNIILVGELRDPRAVVEAVTAALSGHLVISTFHAGDLISGLTRIAASAQGIDKDIHTTLSKALKVVMHLSLHNYDPNAPGMKPEVKGTGTPPRVLKTESLVLTGEGESARTMIRDGEFQQLVSEIARQKRGLMMGTRPLMGTRSI